ncbi:glycosyltransferase [Priestia abyssalis]|uniref:glycosyltransferase n=1 Tax=Priestia abyssalis TaxID=1221450 RepID=UPI0009958E71|nr:glycosyltransferase [Priestia abyssalis]
MIKIAMVIPNWGKECGIADYTKQLIENMNERLVAVSVISQIDKSFVEFVKSNKVDIVHFQYEYSMYDTNSLKSVMNILVNLKIPIVTTFHSLSNRMKLQHDIISFYSSSIIVHSDHFKQLCINHGFPEKKLIVIPMGCHPFPLETTTLNENLIDIKGRPCIGFFGFPFPNKGISPLIDAINELKASFPEITGYFFAHLPNSIDKHHPAVTYQKELETKIAQYAHLKWYQEYLPVSTLVKLLNKMDVNVLPYTTYQGNGISSAAKLLLMAGKPIVVTDSIHFSDLSDEVYKIPRADVRSIANGIREVLLNKGLQERLFVKTNLFVKRNSWKKIANRYYSYYKKIMILYKKL